MNIGYKAKQSKAHGNKIRSELTQSTSGQCEDPPVDYVPPPSLFIICEWVLSAKECQSKGSREDLINDLEQIYKALCLHHSITKEFLEQSDICRFLLVIAPQHDDLKLQLISIKLIHVIISKSVESIDIFLSFGGYHFINQLPLFQNEQIKLLGFEILRYIPQTSLGTKEFLRTNTLTFLIECFEASVQNSDDVFQQQILFCICCTFCNMCRFISMFPDNVPLLILGLFFDAMKRVDKPFPCQLSIEFSEGLLRYTKEKGLNQLVISHLFNQYNLLLRPDFPLHLQILQLFVQIADCCISSDSSIITKIDINTVKAFLLGFPHDSKEFQCSISIIKDFVVAKQHEKWITDPKIIKKLRDGIDAACFESKALIVECISSICYCSSIEVLQQIFQTDLISACLDAVECLEGKRLKTVLITLRNALQRMIRFGTDSFQNFDQFEDEFADVLKYNADNENKEIADVASAILQEFYPEIYYA
ncbi:hypothetical protein GPJ56_007784 [Histomonas meleagridis]|uniref:uncharacterized protein n=1 Tax=Histomonas meleagridis TaxID=135588 RepID=UPI00355A6618|nr:hypothetical protein GPJ56_007784 [Histomonas meleagridis]KAH0798737.1 hypothetical protein GO595_008602 [Histomonas meleagridis]